MKYITDDGMTFKNVEDAEKHEAELKEEEEKKKKILKEKDDRKKEILDAFDRYEELLKKYYEDYPEDKPSDSADWIVDFFDKLF